MARRFTQWLTLLGGFATLCLLAASAQATHPRPKSASPLSLSLVPAYKQCTYSEPGSGTPSQANREHGPPVMDDDTAEQVKSLMAKGFAGTIFLRTDDVQASFDELRARGVEFVEEPEERPYGIDSSFRDPSGNHFRLTQIREMAAV